MRKKPRGHARRHGNDSFGVNHVTSSVPEAGTMNEKDPTYRVELKNNGTSPDETYEWKIYRNREVLPVLRSKQLFVSRLAGLADAYRARLQLVDTEVLG
jgi:hypothetical protein